MSPIFPWWPLSTDPIQLGGPVTPPTPSPSTGGVYRLGDRGPEVRAVKVFLRSKFAAYAGALSDTDEYDQATADVVSEMQRRYQIPVSGVFEYGSQIRAGFVPKPVLLTCNGFMGSMWEQMPADTARALGDYFEWQPVGYNSGAFPLGTGADSGVRELKRLINDVYPNRKFALAGYSLGAIITGDVLDAIRSGDLTHRQGDFIGYVSWGDPRHPAENGFEGIAGAAANLQNVAGWHYHTDCNSGDMYCHKPIGEAGEPYTLIFNLVMLKWDGSLLSILDEAVDLVRRPIPEVVEIITSIISAIGFYSNQGPHMNYGIDGAVQFLRGLIFSPTGGFVTTPTPGTPQTGAKAIVGLIGAVLSFVVPFVLQVSSALPAPWPAIIGGVVAVLSALGVYSVPNTAKRPKVDV